MRRRQIKNLKSLPTGAFLATIAVVCAGLAVSAGYSFLGLSHLRDQILHKRADHIADTIDARVRGPGRRNNPAFWQAVMEERLQAHRDLVAFLALVDQQGRVLARAGEASAQALAAPPGIVASQGSALYVFEESLASPRRHRDGAMTATTDWRIRVGVYTESAASIMNQAVLHLVVSGVTILTLLGLTYYFLRTLRRFLELKAREDSERHLAALGKMAATLAHEIRNPLGAMKGLTQVVQEEVPKHQQTYALMQTIITEAGRLERLVNDLLTFARPRDSQIKRFDLNELIADVRTMLQSKIDAAGTRLNIVFGSDSLVIQSDENGLRQLLLNVILNAVEATPPDGTVTISARINRKKTQLVIDVDDEGAGLGDRNPEELFQPFVTTKLTGSGLGLPISRQIVDRLGGAIELTNRPQGGARCRITLPARVRWGAD